MFQIEWIPTAAIEALADKRGRPSRDESPLDYCEADDAACVIVMAGFEDAVRVAKAKLPEDYFGQVRIEHVVKVTSRRMRDRWDFDAVWHVDAEDNLLDENEPDFLSEVDLIDDEAIA